MNHAEYLDFHRAVMQRCFEVTGAKNHDYTPELDDAFGNFRGYNLVGVTEEKGILARIVDKLCRIGALLARPAKVLDECIEQTAEDAINYLVLFLGVYCERKNDFSRYAVQMSRLKEARGPEEPDADYQIIQEEEKKQAAAYQWALEQRFYPSPGGLYELGPVGNGVQLHNPEELRKLQAQQDAMARGQRFGVGMDGASWAQGEQPYA